MASPVETARGDAAACPHTHLFLVHHSHQCKQKQDCSTHGQLLQLDKTGEMNRILSLHTARPRGGSRFRLDPRYIGPHHTTRPGSRTTRLAGYSTDPTTQPL